MRKFKLTNGMFLIDDNAPEELVVNQQYSPNELLEKINEYSKQNKDYLDSHIATREKMCKMFGINKNNYTKSFFGKDNYELLMDFKKFREEAEQPKIIFDLSVIGKGNDGFSYIKEVLSQIDFGDKKPTVCLQFTGEEDTINNSMPLMFTEKEFNEIKQCEKELSEKGITKQIFIQEGELGDQLTLEEIEQANKFVDAIVSEVKNLNLSPFETVVYVHDKCSQFFYNWKDKGAGANLLTDILKSGNIRCVGYATMFKAIIDELNIDGLKASLCSVYGSRKQEGHALNTVAIKDEKYGIDGEFMQDACFSACSQAKNNNDFAYCLFPVEDFVKMYQKDFRVVNDVNLRMFYDLEHKHVTGIQQMEEESAKAYLEKTHAEFLRRLKNKGTPIDVQKYAKAYFVGLVNSGMSEQNASALVEQKINRSIAVVSSSINSENATSSFFIKDVDEKFLKDNLSEYQFVDYQLKQLESKNIETLSENEQQKLLDKILELKKQRDLLFAEESIGNEKNKKLIEEIMHQK